MVVGDMNGSVGVRIVGRSTRRVQHGKIFFALRYCVPYHTAQAGSCHRTISMETKCEVARHLIVIDIIHSLQNIFYAKIRRSKRKHKFI